MGTEVMIKDTVQAVKRVRAMWGTDCCELRCPDVRLMRSDADDHRISMTPDFVVIRRSRQAAQAYKSQVVEMLGRKVSQGFAELSLVDQRQLWPSSQLPSQDLGP